MNERPRLGRGNNWHHTFWQRSWYDNRIALEHRFREEPALVIPMCENVHSQLHRDMEPPLKPNHEQMARLLGAVALWTPQQGRLAGVETAMEELYLIGTEGTDTAHKRATMLSLHLAKQLSYMEAGVPVGRAQHGRAA